MILKPKPVAPGWAKRWTRQSTELFRRAPGLAVAVMALFALVNVFVPQPLALDVPITVFLVGLLFASLRAADQDSGNPWTATWTFFRQTARDLAHLARDVFLFMLVIGAMAGLLFHFYLAATHGSGVIRPDPAYFQLPGGLRHGAARAGNMLALGIFLPGTIPMIFLTMSTGNQPLMHYNVGYQAAVLNMRPSLVFLGGLLACSFSSSLLQRIPSPILGYALMAVFTAFFWWFGAWGYLWCREMFEGTAENAKETAKRRVHAMAQGGSHA